MKLLFIGDIVAKPGRRAVQEHLHEIRNEYDVDLVIANAENLSHGRGASPETLQSMLDAGVDFFSGGDHLFGPRGTEFEFEDWPLIRPYNYPQGTPGDGYKIIEVRNGDRVLLINLMGRTFLNERLDDPFRAADEILENVKSDNYDFCIVDFHAEATSEKMALAFYLDGRVDAVVGTHTHVPTCDHRKLPKGTLYVTDVGMTGNIDSVIGVEKDIIINLYLTGINQRFEWEESGDRAFRSVLIDTKEKTIDRVDR